MTLDESMNCLNFFVNLASLYIKGFFQRRLMLIDDFNLLIELLHEWNIVVEKEDLNFMSIFYDVLFFILAILLSKSSINRWKK